MIGHINLDKKVLGERRVRNPHAAFDVARTGNGSKYLPRLISTLPVGSLGLCPPDLVNGYYRYLYYSFHCFYYTPRKTLKRIKVRGVLSQKQVLLQQLLLRDVPLPA
jgi:hypothetical protein